MGTLGDRGVGLEGDIYKALESQFWIYSRWVFILANQQHSMRRAVPGLQFSQVRQARNKQASTSSGARANIYEVFSDFQLMDRFVEKIIIRLSGKPTHDSSIFSVDLMICNCSPLQAEGIVESRKQCASSARDLHVCFIEIWPINCSVCFTLLWHRPAHLGVTEVFLYNFTLFYNKLWGHIKALCLLDVDKHVGPKRQRWISREARKPLFFPVVHYIKVICSSYSSCVHWVL